MGQKYASMHVYGGGQDKNLLILKDFCNNNKTVNVMLEEILKKIEDPEKRLLVEKFSSPSNILIVQSKDVLSIYDGDLSFEMVEERAKQLSKKINNPVIYTSNFDDDIFIFGIYQSGEFITGRKMGDGLADYDISPEDLEIEKFYHGLSLNKAINTRMVLENSEEVEALEDELERILEAPLKFSIEDVREDYEKFTELFTENHIQVFKRHDR